jgi:hypothetical protein
MRGPCRLRVADGYVFRPVNRGGQVKGAELSEKVVWQLLQGYAAGAGVQGIAPHDLRRYAESRTMPNALGSAASSRQPTVIGSA